MLSLRETGKARLARRIELAAGLFGRKLRIRGCHSRLGIRG
jgi:hypothetical protein